MRPQNHTEEHLARHPHSAIAIAALAHRIRGEYYEMPGLSLTAPQAERLWGLDCETCAVILRTLVERGILRRTSVGMYVRA